MDILGRKSVFCFGTTNFVNRVYHQYTRVNNFPIGADPKKIPFPSYGSFPGAHPGFWPFWASPKSLVCTLFFGPWPTKLGKTVRATKKMTHNDNRPGPSWNCGEMAVFTLCFLGQKSVFLFTLSCFSTNEKAQYKSSSKIRPLGLTF